LGGAALAVTILYGAKFMSRKVIVLLSLLSCIFLTIALADDDKKVSPVETITIEEIKDHMYFLASDELGGRVLGSPGYEIAAKYAATQFRAAGIKPILKDKDGKDTYLQEVPVTISTINGPTSFNLITPSGTKNIGNKENLKLLGSNELQQKHSP
jgi:aminopeptidase YwaD